MRVIRRRQRQWHCSRCPESTCARSKGVEMSKRSKRMLKLMTLRVGCAELLQAARSHPGCSPPFTNPRICVIPPKSVSRFFAPPLLIASLFRMELCLLLLSA